MAVCFPLDKTYAKYQTLEIVNLCHISVFHRLSPCILCYFALCEEAVLSILPIFLTDSVFLSAQKVSRKFDVDGFCVLQDFHTEEASSASHQVFFYIAYLVAVVAIGICVVEHAKTFPISMVSIGSYRRSGGSCQKSLWLCRQSGGYKRPRIHGSLEGTVYI